MKNLRAEISEKVFSKRPVLREILNDYGKSSLKDYVQKFWQLVPHRPERFFLDVLKNEACKIYGKETSEAIANQIQRKPLISTIDHHGIWNHPIFVNSALIHSLHFIQGELAIILSTESVSLNNTSSWSGSLLYHSNNTLIRGSFFPDRFKTLPVFSAPAINMADIERVKTKSHQKIKELITDLNVVNVAAEGGFSRQASILSSLFWQKVFPSAPKLIYLPMETVVLKYLFGAFQDPQDLLSRLVLTKQGRGLWQKYFSSEHTFLFWGIDDKGRRRALSQLPQKPAELLKLMEQKKIYPSSPLCFIVLLKAGLVCPGGFNQTTWLTEVKSKFMSLLEELEPDKGQAASLAKIPTKNFAESSLAWLKFGNDYVMPTAVDLFFSGRDLYPNYSNLASSLNLGQSLNLAMPSIYSVVVPKAQHFPGFNLDKAEKEIFEQFDMEKVMQDAGL